ncbi:MAG: apolipoprotein N-acyltransferase, partial [Paracoccaceae bacterium]
GAGYFALALNWIVEPFMVDAPTYGWMAPFALVGLSFGMALFWAAACGIGMLARRPLVGLVTVLAAAELLRGYVLTGFPWAMIGHIWIDTPPMQLAAVVGPSGLTLVTLAICGLAATLQNTEFRIAIIMAFAIWTFGDSQLASTAPPTSGLMLRLVQPDAPQDAKWDPDHAQLFFQRLMQSTSAPGRVDLVIWPETALPYLLIDNPDLPALIGAAGHGAPVAVGLQRVDGARGFNTLQVFASDGSTIATYDKHHLVPFGEYIPFGDLAYDWFGLKAFAAQTGHAYSAGPGPQVLDLGRLGKTLPLICYEAVFPQDLRTSTRPDWLLQITNDAWFGTLSGPFQHAAQARLRAVEQGLPLVRVANTGVTEMVDARGRVTASLPFGEPGYLDTLLPGPLPATLYAQYGEIPVLLLLAALAIAAMVKRRPRTA